MPLLMSDSYDFPHVAKEISEVKLRDLGDTRMELLRHQLEECNCTLVPVHFCWGNPRAEYIQTGSKGIGWQIS